MRRMRAWPELILAGLPAEEQSKPAEQQGHFRKGGWCRQLFNPRHVEMIWFFKWKTILGSLVLGYSLQGEVGKEANMQIRRAPRDVTCNMQADWLTPLHITSYNIMWYNISPGLWCHSPLWAELQCLSTQLHQAAHRSEGTVLCPIKPGKVRV